MFNGLKMLSTFDKNYSGGSISSNEDMAAYLQPRILGVLAHFDSQLLNASIPMEEKRPVGGCLLFVAIDSSFNDLIVMCKHVLSMVMMILTLLYFFTSLLSFLPDSGKPDFHYPADGFQDHQWHTAQGDEHTEDWPPDNGRGLHRDLVSRLELLCTQVILICMVKKCSFV